MRVCLGVKHELVGCASVIVALHALEVIGRCHKRSHTTMRVIVIGQAAQTCVPALFQSVLHRLLTVSAQPTHSRPSTATTTTTAMYLDALPWPLDGTKVVC